MMDQLEENSILFSTHHGFRKLCPCEAQLLQLLEKLTSSLNKKKQTDITIMHFEKTFDHVSHSLLCHRLSHFGIRGVNDQWISSFLHERRQAVTAERARSEFNPHTIRCTTGVSSMPLSVACVH